MRALLLLALFLAACAAARRGARHGFSSGSRSTSGRRFHSTSPAESTGRPDAVTDADGSQSAAAADMATVLQRASLISRLRAGKAPGHGGPPQIRVGGGGAARIWDGDAEPPSMLATARRSCRAAAMLSQLRSSPSLVVVGLAETQRRGGRTLFCLPCRLRRKMRAVFAYSVGACFSRSKHCARRNFGDGSRYWRQSNK